MLQYEKWYYCPRTNYLKLKSGQNCMIVLCLRDRIFLSKNMSQETYGDKNKHEDSSLCYNLEAKCMQCYVWDSILCRWLDKHILVKLKTKDLSVEPILKYLKHNLKFRML